MIFGWESCQPMREGEALLIHFDDRITSHNLGGPPLRRPSGVCPAQSLDERGRRHRTIAIVDLEPGERDPGAGREQVREEIALFLVAAAFHR